MDQCDDADLVSGLMRPLSDYSAMMLDRIQTDFLALSGAAAASQYTELADRVDWLCALLDAYSPMDAGELDEIGAQRTLVHGVKDRLAAAVDYYGHSPDWVPLGSIEFYRLQFTTALKTLRDVESECDRHITALTAATESASALQQAKDALTARQSAYSAAADAEHKAITRLIAAVEAKDAEATEARKVLDTAVEAFKKGIQEACGLTYADFLDTLNQCAFLGHEPFQQMAMLGGQTLKLLDTADTTVADVDGQQIDKNLMIRRLTAVSFSSAELQQIHGGKDGVDLADPGAVKLVAEQDSFDQLCDKFWNITGAAAAEEDFDAYVAAVQARNAEIISLNESIHRLREWVAGQQQTQAAIAASDALAAEGALGGASAIVAQLQRMVARARADCIANVYLAGRAYGFWSLTGGEALASALSDLSVGQPLAMTSTALDAAGEQILAKYSKAIDAGLKDRPITFPPLQSAPGEGGILVRITEESQPGVIERLRTRGHTSVRLRPARRGTTADENKFAGHLNVRLTMARCWVHGVHWKPGTGSEVRVDIEHEGRESIVTIDDALVVVRHDPVHVITKYDSKRPADPAGLTEVSDLQDGSPNAVGAQVGPFARWRIVVDPALNPGVDLSQVTEITFEFHGSAVWQLS